MFHVNAVYDVLNSFLDGNFLLRPLIKLSLTSFLVIVFQHVRLSTFLILLSFPSEVV